ncbi:unnamed protein product [Calypogeia fissa]
MLTKCVPLGAGQDVGKSCVIVTIGSKNIMFDCGMHMGYQDERRRRATISQVFFPLQNWELHSGYFVCDHYSLYPTKALAPLMLEDYRKVLVDQTGEQELFSTARIQQCMKKVTAVDLKQTIMVDNGLEIRSLLRWTCAWCCYVLC